MKKYIKYEKWDGKNCISYNIWNILESETNCVVQKMTSFADLENHNGSFRWLNQIHLLRRTFITPEYLNNGSLNYINRIMAEENACDACYWYMSFLLPCKFFVLLQKDILLFKEYTKAVIKNIISNKQGQDKSMLCSYI